jgi:hypothetical protein
MHWLIQRRMKRLALFLYVCLIPLTFPFLGMEGIKVTHGVARGARAACANGEAATGVTRAPTSRERAADVSTTSTRGS